jgi:hypothetical protein
MTDSAPFPLVQFQFQVERSHGSASRQRASMRQAFIPAGKVSNVLAADRPRLVQRIARPSAGLRD